jgi:hypothetical protein
VNMVVFHVYHLTALQLHWFIYTAHLYRDMFFVLTDIFSIKFQLVAFRGGVGVGILLAADSQSTSSSGYRAP